LGGDSSAAAGGGHADPGDREGDGCLQEHGEARALVVDGPPRYQRPVGGSIVDAVEPQIRELLGVWPSMPATVVAERIGWQRSIRVLGDRVAEVRPV